jgi:hypothetical protein
MNNELPKDHPLRMHWQGRTPAASVPNLTPWTEPEPPKRIPDNSELQPWERPLRIIRTSECNKNVKDC